MTAIPERIGKYELQEELGRGSMGVVCAGYDPFSDARVAVKIAHPNLSGDTDDAVRFKKLFFNEAHAAGALKHPNILRVIDGGIEGPLCYLVMEYVSNAATLQPYCQADSLLPTSDVAGIVYKIARALDYAHRHGVIHRDVKPNNILYTEDHNIKLADFSIAMVNRADLDLTQVTGFLGSPMYMSPEQIKEEEIGATSDLFSLGVVTYEMLTGHHPFKAGNLPEITHKITTEQPPALTQWRPDLAGELDEVVQRMLVKDPARRYRDGLALAGDLAELFDNLDGTVNSEGMQDKFTALREFGFFKRLTDADLCELTRTCLWQQYPAGTAVITEGENEHSAYLLLSGVVSIEKNGRCVTTLQAGDCFGEMGYLSKARRTANVRAKTDVALIKVSAETIDCADEGAQLRFHKAFVQALIERLADTTTALTSL